ncbi:hypothetical protein ACWEGQ_15300, partial [Streptomyces seoulensis]
MRELDQTLRAMNPAPSGAPAEQVRLDAILATPRGPARTGTGPVHGARDFHSWCTFNDSPSCWDF